MSSLECASGTPFTTLIEYWLGELHAAEESVLEEHLFDCNGCHSRLGQLARLGQDIRSSMRAGQLSTVLTPAFVAQLKESGLRVREYRLGPGGSVACTVAPDDDLVIAHLHAPLAGIERVDLVCHDAAGDMIWRKEDIAFVPGAEEVAVASNLTILRQMSFVTQRMELVAVEGSRERVIGRYTFNHSPHVADA